MPIPNHCIECDTPIMKDVMCDKCKEKEDNTEICDRCGEAECHEHVGVDEND